MLSFCLAKLVSLPKPLVLLVLFPALHVIPGVCALKGDSWCGTLMCVHATVNASRVRYELDSLNQLGWMSIGFGSQMANTSLVILWPNPDGSVTISQRWATGHVEPQPESSPARIAKLESPDKPTPGTIPTLAFDVSQNNDSLQQLIWAFGVMSPTSRDPAANIEQHLDAGSFSLDLTKDLEEETPSSEPTTSASASATPSTPSSPSSPSPSIPVTTLPLQSGILTIHAILSVIGFLVLLPISTLVARWSRTSTSQWLKVHWSLNILLGIPFITIGWALGPLFVAQQGRAHMVNAHQICGVIIFVLFLLQVTLGTLIHSRRLKPISRKLHPPQNIIHILLGVLIISLAFYETKSGATREWIVSSKTRAAITALWATWAAILPISYFSGLRLLKKQLAQERLGWNEPTITYITPNVAGSSILPQAERWVEDDGTHDIFSDMRSGHRSGSELARSRRDDTEMREVEHVLPVTVPLPG